MKKIFLIISIILFSIPSSILIVLQVKLNNEKKNFQSLNKEYNLLTNKKEITEEENNNYKEKIDVIKKEKINKINEENIWKETKQKLEKALS